MSRLGGYTILVLLVAAVLLDASPLLEAKLTCRMVYKDVTPCVHYLRIGGTPPPECCQGVLDILATTRTRTDRRTLCACLKTMAAGLAGRLNLGYAVALPGKCKTTFPIRIGSDTNCTTIK